jgi:CheY-like chemotaxis protein
MATLHVEDQEVIRDVVRRALEASGFSVVSAAGVRAARLALTERDDIMAHCSTSDCATAVAWTCTVDRHRAPELAQRVAFVRARSSQK